MKKTTTQFALLLTAALIGSASAQQASPSTFTLPASVYATAPLTTAPAAVATTSTPTPAATTTNAVVTVPGSQPMVMPLNIYTLPYGTVTIASGVYFIPNYENTGISIYIQSPAPLKIATLEEMVRYQAEWARLTQQVTQPAAQLPAQPVQQAAPVAASVPVQTTATAAVPLPAAPVFMPAAQVGQAPVDPSYVTPVAAAPAANFPAAAAAFSATLPSGGAQAFAMPTPTASTQTPAAQAPQTQTTAQPVPQPQVVAQAQQPSPATPAWSAPLTLVPNYLRLNFRAIGSTVSYSVSNLSDSSSLQIDPRSLRVYQAGQPVEAQLTVRDSSTGAASGTLAPRAMLVGSVKALTRSGDALTLTWTARDAQGKTYPISYAWLPQ